MRYVAFCSTRCEARVPLAVGSTLTMRAVPKGSLPAHLQPKELQQRIPTENVPETGVPDIKLSQQRLLDHLETDPRTGELLPLNAPLAAFEEIGTGIAAYMSLVLQLRDLFWFLFLLALANLITNIFGGALGDDASLLTVASIANAPRLTPAYGAMEAVAGYALTHAISVILGRLKTQAIQIDRDELTAVRARGSHRSQRLVADTRCAELLSPWPHSWLSPQPQPPQPSLLVLPNS